MMVIAATALSMALPRQRIDHHARKARHCRRGRRAQRSLARRTREALAQDLRFVASKGRPPGIDDQGDCLASSGKASRRLPAETRRLLRSAISRVEGDILARDKRAAIANGGAVNTADGVESVAGDDPPATVSPTPCERRRLTPGARLMREWGGRTHVVDVIEGGYVFEAKVYPSLTAIASKITGVHWSGPRFFGQDRDSLGYER